MAGLQKINWTQIDSPNVPDGVIVDLGSINKPINAVYSNNIYLTGTSIGDLYLNSGSFENGTITLTSNSGNTITVSGISSFDTFITGVTFENNTLEISRNDGISFYVNIDNFTGLTVNGSISGNTYYGDGSNLTGVSKIDTFVTGGTYSNGTILFTNNFGETFNVDGLYTGTTQIYVTGGTHNQNTGVTTFVNSTGGTFQVSSYFTPSDDIHTTGVTFIDDQLTITDSNGNELSTVIPLNELYVPYSGATKDVELGGNQIKSRAIILDGEIQMNHGLNNVTIEAVNITDNQNLQIPDKTGTIALSVNGNMANNEGEISLSIPTVTPSALTKTDDTNVTLTLGGSPSTALLSGTSLTLGWTGTLDDSRITSASTWNSKQNAITLTTTGSTGSSIFINDVLNVPTYTLSGLGGQPQLSGYGFVKISGTTISYDNSDYYLSSNPNSYISLTGLSSNATGLTYTNTTGVFSISSGYVIPTTTQESNWNTSYTNRITSLTTIGESGDATLISNVLNIPNYSTDITGIVPYTGATKDVNLGTNNLTANVITTTGGIINTFFQSDTEQFDFYFPTGDNKITFYGRGITGTGASLQIMFDNLSDYTNRTYNWPNANGTFALSVNGYSANTAGNITIPIQAPITLTTTGTTGASVLIGNTLNIPQYISSQWTTTGTSIYYTNNVLIGTTSDDGSKLRVVGNTSFKGTNYFDGGTVIMHPSGYGAAFLNHSQLWGNGDFNIKWSPTSSTWYDNANPDIIIKRIGSSQLQFTNGVTGYTSISVGSVGINTTSINSTAALQVDSTTKGFLPPRMTTTERDNISSPATGLTLYNTTTNTNDFFNGTSWSQMMVGNIYNTDGSLTTGRTLNLNTYDLNIAGTTTTKFFADGNVLIGGGSAGGYKLDVNGTTLFRNNITITTDKAITSGSGNNAIYWGTTGIFSGGWCFTVPSTKAVLYSQDYAYPTTGSSAMLEIQSTTKGFLTSRMTELNKNSIVTPATGLLIYQTNGTSGFYYYNGTSWLPFSGSGTVTNVSELTLGTSGTDLSSTVVSGTTTPVITLNVPTASASNRGVLSPTDWSTFNGKQNVITLTTTGSTGSSTFISDVLNVPTYTLSGLGGQPQLSGYGFVKISGTTVSYVSGTTTDFIKGDGSLDGNTYITSSSLIPYVPYTGATQDVNIGIYTLTADHLIKNGGQDTQFLKADGSVDNNVYLTSADLPSTLDLFATTYSSGINGYSTLVRNISDFRYNTTAVDVSTGAITGTAQYISGLISDVNIIAGNPGIFNITTIGNIRRTSGSGDANFYFEVYKRTSGGTETFITQSNNTIPVIDGGVYVEFNAVALWNDGVFLPTDRIVIKYYSNRIAGGSNPTYQFQFGGITPVRSYAAIPVAVIPNIFLKDLADVENVAPLDKEALYWNDTAQLWEHNSISDILGYTPQQPITLTTTGSTGSSTFISNVLNVPQYQSVLTNPVTGTGMSTRIAFWDSTSSISSNGDLYWDNSNNRLGIGTTSPITQLDLGSSTGSAGTINKLALYSSGFGTYGFGISPAQLDYVSGGAHVFYRNSPSTDELFRIGNTGTLTALSLVGTGTRMVVTNSTGELSTQSIPSGSGTVTDVAALTLGTTGTDLSSTVVNGTTTPVITLNVPTASASNRGALSSTDWSTFNSKQNGLYGTGFVKISGTTISYDNSTYLSSVGTGTTNELTYWSGTNTLGSLTTATYPSLTELSYVKGVTSSVQTQIDNKTTFAQVQRLIAIGI